MNKIAGTALAVILLLAGLAASAQEKGKVSVSAAGAKAQVWIDGRSVGAAPASAELAEGVHSIRVQKDTGETYERKIKVKPNAKINLVADFGKKDITIANTKELGYNPGEGATFIPISAPKPTTPETSKPEDEKTKEPPAASAGAGDKTNDTTAPSETKAPGYRECKPGEWCPEPSSNSVGPPIPPNKTSGEPGATPATTPATGPGKDTAKPAEVTKLTTPKEKKPEAAKPEEKKPVTKPCEAKAYPNSCAIFGANNDATSVLYSYYCTLANHDLDRAYKMWSIGQDVNWFYQSSANFCSVDDFRINNLTTLPAGDGQMDVNYSVDFIDGRGRVIESRQMTATMVKRGDEWALRKNVRR